MALDEDCVKIKNDEGLLEIGVGAKNFMCIGTSPPHDHPHLYLIMPDSGSIRCLYCNTNFLYNSDLQPHETEPAGNIFEEKN